MGQIIPEKEIANFKFVKVIHFNYNIMLSLKGS